MQTPTDTPSTTEPRPLPQTQSLAEARDLLSFATQALSALRRADERLAPSVVAGGSEEPASSSEPSLGMGHHDEERAWLAAAARRVQSQVAGVEAALEQASDLPELESERRARAEALFTQWVDAAEALLVGISTHASPMSPLIEVLFPHQKLEKVRRGSASSRAYMAEVDRRRNLAYVVRLSGEPEYAFLRPLLTQFDDGRQALEQQEQPITKTPEELESVRHTVLFAADALRSVLHQARLLADAALQAYPGYLGELGLDAKPKKRAARGLASADPA